MNESCHANKLCGERNSKDTVKRKKNLERMLARVKKKKMNKIKLEMEMD